MKAVIVLRQIDDIWTELAFCARYGHQSVSEMLKWPMPNLDLFSSKLADLIKKEVPDGN